MNNIESKDNAVEDDTYELLIVGGEDHKTGNADDMEKKA